jgi:hypothetical protein
MGQITNKFNETEDRRYDEKFAFRQLEMALAVGFVGTAQQFALRQSLVFVISVLCFVYFLGPPKQMAASACQLGIYRISRISRFFCIKKIIDNGHATNGCKGD